MIVGGLALKSNLLLSPTRDTGQLGDKAEIDISQSAAEAFSRGTFVGLAAKCSMHFFCSSNEFIAIIGNTEKSRCYKRRNQCA